jgi:hypothetical protein
MPNLDFSPPDEQSLLAGLRCTLEDCGMVLLAREPSPTQSSFPAELLTLRLSGGRAQIVLCKYAADAHRESHRHRHSILGRGL